MSSNLGLRDFGAVRGLQDEDNGVHPIYTTWLEDKPQDCVGGLLEGVLVKWVVQHHRGMTMVDVCCICYMNECYCCNEWSDVIYYQYTIYANRYVMNDAILKKLSLKYLLIMKLSRWFHTLPSYCWKLGFDSSPSTNRVRIHPLYGFFRVGSNPSEPVLREITLVGRRESGNPYQRGFVSGLHQHTPVGDSVWDLCTKIPELWI